MSRLLKIFDQPLELVKLGFASDQGRAGGLDDDEVVDAERGDEIAFVGDDDRIRRIDDEHGALGGITLGIGFLQSGQGAQSPTSLQS